MKKKGGSKPTISIIIPAKNEEKWIEATLKGLVKEMKNTKYEIVISDGRSNDKTVAIAKKYVDKIVVYKGKKRQTIAQGRNLGAEKAHGEFFVFIDADTRIPNTDEFFSTALASFKKNVDLVGLTVNIRVDPVCERWSDWIVYAWLNSIHKISNNLFHAGKASGEFQMVKASAFRKINGYNGDLVASEDYDLFIRLSHIGRTRLEPSLNLYHSGRHARKTGWPRLLLKWWMNAVSRSLLNRSLSKEWEVIR